MRALATGGLLALLAWGSVGCAERFIRTLKEQLLWIERFATVEDLRLALLAFKDRYNREWPIERDGHRCPAAVRAAFADEVAA